MSNLPKYARGVAEMVCQEMLHDSEIKLTDDEVAEIEHAIYRTINQARARNTNILKEGI